MEQSHDPSLRMWTLKLTWFIHATVHVPRVQSVVCEESYKKQGMLFGRHRKDPIGVRLGKQRVEGRKKTS